MTADLSTFAKVRALHNRTDIPGEKAAAANRMEALARAAGMTVAEAVSKVDEAASRPAPDIDWSAFAEAFWKTDSTPANDAPDAPCRRRGMPIYDPDRIECWRDVAEHCWQLDWVIPKAHGGKFLTKDERARLKVLAQHYGSVTNATADWLETVLARIETARQSWRDRGKGGVRPDRSATESDIEKAAQIIGAAKRREAPKLNDPQEPQPQPRSQAQAAADAFNEFFNRPEFVAERNEREARRRVEAAAIIERYGSEDALFEDTPMEAALRAACEPLLGPGETWNTIYRLDGWEWVTGGPMPESVRAAMVQGWPLPETVIAAWAEFEATDRLMGERWTVEPSYEPHLYARARQDVVEGICNTLPARSLNDLRARGAWLAFQANAEVEQRPDERRTLIATLRADIERMGARLREHDAAAADGSGLSHGAPVQNGQSGQGSAPGVHPFGSPDTADQSGVQNGQGEGGRGSIPPSPAKPEFYEEVVKPASGPASVQSGHLRRTNAAKRADVLVLLGSTKDLTDREIARRAGVSPTTVGTIRRAQAARPVPSQSEEPTTMPHPCDDDPRGFVSESDMHDLVGEAFHTFGEDAARALADRLGVAFDACGEAIERLRHQPH